MAAPEVAFPVEARAREPIGARKLETVVYAEPSLLGRVDKKQAAERPPRLPTEIRVVFLVDDNDLTTRIEGLCRGHETREPGTDNQHIGALARFGG